ncbi:hypothetical protein PG995_005666 [Apiospora arundinis]
MLLSLSLWLLPSLVLSQTPTSNAPPAWETGVETIDGTCGGTTGFVCTPTWGSCCSKDGMCGRSSKFCGEGCQPSAGNCNAPPVKPPGPGSMSPDGSCGGSNQFNCTGSAFGDCCSANGFCGKTTAHCGSTCQPLFGTCGPPSNISEDGACGGSSKKTCLGSTFGACCSSGGWCGATTDHCSTGCQSAFGACTSVGGGNPPPSGDTSTDGSCGANGKTCKGSVFGECCSASGFCGDSEAHCGPGCQFSASGNCTAADSNVSVDGTCGANGKTCKGSTFGDCCSSSGFCGSTSGHCTAGCQSGFGTCSGAGDVSVDGSCGKNGMTCKGSTFGDCCSSSGYCGKTSTHCGAGCQTPFGTCEGTGNVSTDGSCGKNGKTCKGSTFGDCCSSSGYCGKTSTHCGAGCQSSFGTCDSGAGSVSTDGNCGKNGKTCVGSTFGSCCSSNGYCGNTNTHCGQGW